VLVARATTEGSRHVTNENGATEGAIDLESQDKCSA